MSQSPTEVLMKPTILCTFNLIKILDDWNCEIKSSSSSTTCFSLIPVLFQSTVSKVLSVGRLSVSLLSLASGGITLGGFLEMSSDVDTPI